MSKVKLAAKAAGIALFGYLKSDKARKFEIALLSGSVSVVVQAIKSALAL